MDTTMIYRPSEHLYNGSVPAILAVYADLLYVHRWLRVTALKLKSWMRPDMNMNAAILQFSTSYNAIQLSGFVTSETTALLRFTWTLHSLEYSHSLYCYFINFVDVVKFVGNYVSSCSRVGTVIFVICDSVAVQIAQQWAVSAVVVY